MVNILKGGIAAARTKLFGYDAVESRGRRKSIAPLTRAEDRELAPGQRYKLVATTRDLPRNFSVAAWAVRKHLDYVSTFTFQSKTGDEDFDAKFEALMRWRARRANCDVARRHSLPRLMRLWEASRVIDGDVLISRLADGRLQTFEGDRIRNPMGALPTELGINLDNVVHGIEIDPTTGASLRYLVSDRKPKSDGLTFTGAVDAKFADLLAYYSRVDQVRGVSPMAPAINTFRDTYENFDYAMAKAKVAQLFALAFYREGDEGNDGTLPGTTEGEEDAEDEPRYKINFNGGPQLLDLDPGDRAEFLESKTPSAEFQSFTTTMIGLGLKALDIPTMFYDESRANYNSGRQGWILYEQAASSKRADLRETLDNSTAFWAAGWILDGSLELPRGKKLRDVSWEWVHAGIPWMDPLKEITSDIAAVKSGMGSRTRCLKERGLDYFEVIDELAAEEAYAEKMGVRLTDESLDLAAMARNSVGEHTQQAKDQ